MSETLTIPPTVTQTAEDLLEIAKDAIDGVREWAGDAAERAAEKVSPPKKKRSKLPLLLLLLGIGAAIFVISRRRSAEMAMDVAPDAFGAAVGAEQEANANGERSTARTPGV